jgi:hypothetical protein
MERSERTGMMGVVWSFVVSDDLNLKSVCYNVMCIRNMKYSKRLEAGTFGIN